MDIASAYKNAMSKLASTVAVIANGRGEDRRGLAVSTFIPVSLDPEHPTILFCVNDSSKTAAAINKNGTFCVNVLNDEHTRLAEVFAGKSSLTDGRKFDCGDWKDGVMPRLANALVALDCSVVQSIRVGTHWIVVGEIIEFHLGEGSPLVYLNRNFLSLLGSDAAR